MAPKGWTTPEQAAFLQVRLPDFLQAQKSGRRQVFLRSVYMEWFAAYPEPRKASGAASEDTGLQAAMDKAHGDAIRKREEVRAISEIVCSKWNYIFYPSKSTIGLKIILVLLLSLRQLWTMILRRLGEQDS